MPQPTPPRSSAPPPPPPQPIDVGDMPVPRMSPSLGRFAPAFVRVQASLEPVIKNHTNPAFKGPKPVTYADLASILDEALPILSANGFGIMQFPSTENGQLALMSMLIHESGEFVSATMPLLLQKADPQGEGSAISYGRRYAACAILGIRTADDDGNEASGRSERPARQQDNRDRQQDTPEPAKTEGWPDAGAEAAAHGAVAAQIKQLFALVPDDHPVRAAIRSYRDEHGWPMAAPLLTELAMRVAKAHGEATSGQEQAETPPSGDPAPEAAAPAPGVPSGQSEHICPGCEKRVVGPKVIKGGTGPDDPVAYYHKSCYDKQTAEQAPPPEEEG